MLDQSVTNLAAQILVKCGYGESWQQRERGVTVLLTNAKDMVDGKWEQLVDPTADSLEGFHQVSIIEDHIRLEHGGLWETSCIKVVIDYTFTTHHQFRLDRIVWCLDDLVERYEL